MLPITREDPSKQHCPTSSPVGFRLLGEDLVAFRDTEGRIGVLDAYCPHRRAPLQLGRNEGCGLRCVYHGWKFDVGGNCVEMPNEPPKTDFKHKVRINSYAAAEWGGYIWVYMGPQASRPPLPQFEWATLPSEHRWQRKWHYGANYMQGLEGELDTCHTSFLHRVDDPSKLSPGLAESTANWGKDGMPQLTVHDTEYGYYYGSQRKLGGGQFNWRLTQWVLPSNSIIPHARFPISSRAYIPIDDENTFVFGTSFNPEQPLTEEDRDYLETGMGAAPKLIPGTFIPEVNRSNDYQRDFIAKRRGHATGIPGINNQDRALVEMMGPITDRSKEHLGTSDIAVIAARRRLLRMAKAMAQGDEPELPHHPTAFAVRPIDVTTDDVTLNDVVERYRGKLRLP